MAHTIAAVEPDGIAEQCGLRPGDTLLSINGEPVLDQVDYQYLTAGERLVLEVRRGAEIEEIHLEKDADEPLGLTFASSLMARPRMCANRCVFCFVDQMPEGMRASLYVKDDDWRLSLMMGNYITLTNLSDREFARIIARRASPLYISVHAMEPGLRARMMGNPRAARLQEQLRRLARHGISFHCPVVLCPGINDGAALDATLEALAALHPAARSVALVPVGLTGHREGLCPLTPYDAASAAALLAQAHAWQEAFWARLGTRFVFAADEFYALSGQPLPPEEAYEDYPQLENGVGLLRSFREAFYGARALAAQETAVPRRVLVATGVSAAPYLRALVSHAAPAGVQARVLAVENRFFGGHVTVAGLLTGSDLLHALAGEEADEILISQAMLRREDALFLDDMPLDALRARLGVAVHAVPCDGADFFYALLGEQYQTED